MSEESVPELPATWKRLSERLSAQSWPQASLYVVATPIGNLGDLGLRAWQALLRCDAIAAEDTRSSRALLDAWGIGTPLLAAHRHNENQAAEAIIGRLARGERIALVSDAGAPAISDPGARIVRRVTEAGFRVIPIPGPSAVIAALMGSGATSDEQPAFAFAGFAPPKAAARRKWLQHWQALDAPVVIFESPHRLTACLDDLVTVCGAQRRLTLARELSKRFEQIHTAPLGELPAWLAQDPHRQQGEFVLILHPAPAGVGDAPGLDPAHAATMRVLLDELSLRDAARIGARLTGLARPVLYEWALAQPRSASD